MKAKASKHASKWEHACAHIYSKPHETWGGVVISGLSGRGGNHRTEREGVVIIGLSGGVGNQLRGVLKSTEQGCLTLTLTLALTLTLLLALALTLTLLLTLALTLVPTLTLTLVPNPSPNPSPRSAAVGWIDFSKFGQID
jgi:hypothetical protein